MSENACKDWLLLHVAPWASYDILETRRGGGMACQLAGDASPTCIGLRSYRLLHTQGDRVVWRRDEARNGRGEVCTSLVQRHLQLARRSVCDSRSWDVVGGALVPLSW